jgi:WD40 repeat protein
MMMIRAKYHVNRLDQSDICKETWSEFPTLHDVAAVCFSPHGKFLAIGSSSPCASVSTADSSGTNQTYISLWESTSVIYPMMEIRNDDFSSDGGSSWTCSSIFWSVDSKYLGCAFSQMSAVRALVVVIAVYNVADGTTLSKRR